MTTPTCVTRRSTARLPATTSASSDSKGLKNSLYDSYVRAIRWASDPVQEGDGGIVGFVTNSGFIDGKSFDGFRKTLAKEFHEVYVYALRAAISVHRGEPSQREGGQGVRQRQPRRSSRPPAGEAARPCHRASSHPTTTTSVTTSLASRSWRSLAVVQFDEIEWTEITPNEQGDWINQRTDDFLKLRPVAAIQSEDTIPSLMPLFESSSREVMSGRDSWVFNSSGEKLHELVDRQVAFYNEQVEAIRRGADEVARDPKQFKWDNTIESQARRGIFSEVRPTGFRHAMYRPILFGNTFTWTEY